MNHSPAAGGLVPILIFCLAAVIAVPLFHRLRLGALIGYLVAGIVIGPGVLALIGDPDTIRGIGEIGVVLLLFVIGLELKLPRLIALRRDIFGLGFAQLVATALALGAATFLVGLAWQAAVVTGLAFSLSATAVALQQLNERGELETPYGERTLSVLLFQDLSIVPILALLPVLAGVAGPAADGHGPSGLSSFGIAAAAIAALVLAGRFLLNPLFRLLASSGAREVMTAAALLVVLGAAVLMEFAGLSMAMGAFLAGLLLADSHFRHQLEADIEPFRGMLLGLFFMSVGMSIDLTLVLDRWPVVIGAALGILAIKIGLAALLGRLFGNKVGDALRFSVLLAPAGEFAFVILPAAAGFGIFDTATGQMLTALAALTMLAGPLLTRALDVLIARQSRLNAQEPDEIDADAYEGAASRILVIGCGRFGQIVNQLFLAEKLDVTVIDNDVECVRTAARFGFKVFFGDGARLDVLRASGAERASIICVCVADSDTATRIVDLLHAEFPQAATYVRAYDRIHAIELMKRDVDYQLRETFESALAFGGATLQAAGRTVEEASRAMEDVRRRDIARLIMQKAGDAASGMELVRGAPVRPEPLTAPMTQTRPLSEETRAIIGDEPA